MIERRRPLQRALSVILPKAERSPAKAIGIRLALALGLVCAMTGLVYIDRGGYADTQGGPLSLLDCFYYTTVSITTTGYGDIVPRDPEARLLTTIIMTPARLLFIVLLVGTTLSVLTERSRHAFRVDRWRKTLKDHVIVCGYGTKGRSVVSTLIGQGYDKDKIVVIDRSEASMRDASANGIAAVQGDTSRTTVLDEARVREARAVVVAVDRDDAAVLTTLTAREMNPRAVISAAVREQENVHLLQQSGADSVITSSDAAGHLLGMATTSPQIVKVIEDLFTSGSGMEMIEREVRREEIGTAACRNDTELAVAVFRDNEIIPFNDSRTASLQAGDRLICVVPYSES